MAIESLIRWPGLFLLLKEVLGSVGDNSPFFINCVKNCNVEICKAGKHEQWQYKLLGFEVSLWSCLENCEYKCQWKTVEAFQRKNWSIPQFRGKWPFIRFFGLQEPASVFFSVINFFVVLKLLFLFRKKVPKKTQYYRVWNIFGLVQLNSWVWSSVYHTRDTDFTERMDYMSAFLLILYSFYAVGLRYTNTNLNLKTLFWSLFCGSIGLNHLTYLWLYNFDYSYNMKLSCLLGGLTAVAWIFWSCLHFQKQYFVWKIGVFGLLVFATAFLELMDFPPILWMIDAHSLWHGSSIIVNIFFFLFVIDDCQYLNYNQLKTENQVEKLD
ncbi:hypothetical protein RUM44_002801 [Polyplax serrata]|uniref:Post-GPI attachment to proteins factor 3 n=1 Tax=Polyplax serrata TaxID=468196 RepID=A0ABR1AFU2_POLSC